MIPRNTTLPFTCTQVFESSEDGQTTITCPVFEGERKLQKDNHLLGNFAVNGLSKKPKGYHKITVKLQVDRDGTNRALLFPSCARHCVLRAPCLFPSPSLRSRVPDCVCVGRGGLCLRRSAARVVDVRWPGGLAADRQPRPPGRRGDRQDDERGGGVCCAGCGGTYAQRQTWQRLLAPLMPMRWSARNP